MKHIIFDTDIGCDCDDAGALGLLHSCADKGLCDIVAITLSTANPWAAGCTDAINRYYGRDISIGQTYVTPPGEDRDYYPKSYGKYIAEKFENGYMQEKPVEAVRLLRRVLGKAQEKITVVVVGNCINMAALLGSEGDEFSPLGGLELVREKVEKVVLMGCFFPSEEVPEVWFGDFKMEAECNIVVDVPAAQTFFTQCPVPVVVSHYLIGRAIRTGGILIKEDEKNPVAACYEVHSHGNRDSWDPVTAYVAVFGEDEYFRLSAQGTVTIDDRGVSAFEEGKGNHCLISCPDCAAAEKRIDNILLRRF